MPLQPRLKCHALPHSWVAWPRAVATQGAVRPIARQESACVNPDIAGGGGSSASTSILERRDPRSASELLGHYAANKQKLDLRSCVSLLCLVEPLRPSVHDERLQNLAREIIAQRSDLSLSDLVDVSRAVQTLGLHDELASLVSLVTESASFLSSDVILSFARTLAVVRRKEGSVVDHHTEASIFRLLSEHVQERMFEAAPKDLADALLAIAVFCCSRNTILPDPAVEAPWHQGIFSLAATQLALEAEDLSADVLLKIFRAFSLHRLAELKRSAEAAGRLTSPDMQLLSGSCSGKPPQPVEDLLVIVADVLARKMHELPAHGVVRAMHSGSQFLTGEHWSCLREAACEELGKRKAELSAGDLSYALEAFSTTAVTSKDTELCQSLFKEVLQHVAAMTPEQALRLLRAAGRLPRTARCEQALELITAEVLRELRCLSPNRLCDALAAFAQLRPQEPALIENLGEAFAAHVERCPPKQLSACLKSLVRLGARDGPVFAAATSQITRDIVGFTERDLSLALWAVAKAKCKDASLLSRAEQYLSGLSIRRLSPADVSMLLWSFSHAHWQMTPDLLSGFTHHAAIGCQKYSDTALLITCLALARMGFTRQPVLVELYRSLYGRLPRLRDSQLALAFLLFSSSGLRDQPLLSRFLFESRRRLSSLDGVNLSNLVSACSRAATKSQLEEMEGLHEGLKHHVVSKLPGMAPEPLLAIFLAAPRLLDFSKDETLTVVESLEKHVSNLEISALVRCLVACARAELLHKPFLLLVFHQLHKKRDELSPSEVVTCISAVHLLGFCKPKLHRSLRFVLLGHVQGWRLPAGELRDVLPALSELGFWERLPPSLQRSIWRIASDDLRRGVAPPPPVIKGPSALDDKEAEAEDKRKSWRLPSIKPGLLRRRHQELSSSELSSSVLSRSHGLQSLRVDAWNARQQRRAEEKTLQSNMQEAAEQQLTPGTPPPTAVDSFIKMVRRL